MLKRFIAFIAALFVLSTEACALSQNDISAECAVLMTAQSGEVIFAKDEHKKHSMASTTKIMTSLIAVQSGRLQNEIKVTDSMVQIEGTSMGLVGGDSVSLKELVYGMLLPSGNDAANVTACYLGGNVDNFVKQMNKKANEIGMKDTNFVTPSGLDDENHYSTAYDMALLGREAVRNPEFLKICSSKKATLTYGNPPYERTLYNHNKLLGSYDSVLGIKTGFTKKSGRCLVTYALRDGIGLVAVTLNDKNDWYDHRQMLDYGFSLVSANEKQPNIPKEIKVVGGNKGSTQIEVPKFITDSRAKNITFRYLAPDFLYAPVHKGDVSGTVEVYLNENLIDTLSVTVCDNVGVKAVEETKENKSVIEKLKEYFHG